MDSDQMHPLAMSGKDPSMLRGDPIPRERYFSKEFMDLEWDHLWTKIWHIAGRELNCLLMLLEEMLKF